MTNIHQGQLIKSEDMEFRYEILVAIYMACKTNELRRIIAPSGTSYCLSFEKNALIISSKTETYDLETNALPFLEAKIGKATKCFANSSDPKTRKPIFYMVWENFKIDEL